MAIDGSGSAGQVAYWVDSDTLGGSDDHFWDVTNKRLGIGTDSPDCPLHVIKGGSQVTVGVFDVAVFQNDSAENVDAWVRILAGSSAKAELQFGYASEVGLQSISCDNAYNEMGITAGKVGIGLGISRPNEKLEVGGKIRANTAFNVSGTDGITQIINIVDKNNVRHTLTFTGGILTSYTTS